MVEARLREGTSRKSRGVRIQLSHRKHCPELEGPDIVWAIHPFPFFKEWSLPITLSANRDLWVVGPIVSTESRNREDRSC